MKPTHHNSPARLEQTRRHFFQDCGYGLGKIALASLLTGATVGSSQKLFADEQLKRPLPPRKPHFAPKAKAVIQLFMAGAPSQLDLFDYKPQLAKFEGKPIPPEIIGGQRYAFIRPDAAALGPRFKFAKHGKSGAEISEVLPYISKIADDLCIVKSMHTEQFNHAPAQIFFNCGFSQPGRPCIGSWALYGLGAETSDLPAFVVMTSEKVAEGGSTNWHNGFLPSAYGGVLLRNKGTPILNLENPSGVDSELQRDTLDLVSTLNKKKLDQVNDPEIAARISAYELSYRLQTSAPSLLDLKSESKQTLDAYGVDPDVPSFARSCLLARRMVEKGVRYISIYQAGWDAHTDVTGNSKEHCKITDQATAALISDLKQRGMLDETLVMWGGEFGRTPMVENSPSFNRKLGRDHHPQAFTVLLAGGGFKGGTTYGATDELGFNVVENKVSVHDLQATVLHQLGLDHERLTYRYAGRDFRLTDVDGIVVKEILA